MSRHSNPCNLRSSTNIQLWSRVSATGAERKTIRHTTWRICSVVRRVPWSLYVAQSPSSCCFMDILRHISALTQRRLWNLGKWFKLRPDPTGWAIIVVAPKGKLTHLSNHAKTQPCKHFHTVILLSHPLSLPRSQRCTLGRPLGHQYYDYFYHLHQAHSIILPQVSFQTLRSKTLLWLCLWLCLCGAQCIYCRFIRYYVLWMPFTHRPALINLHGQNH